MATRKCVICSKEFFAPPSSKKITCGKECSKKRKTQSHLGKRNRWSAESRARLSAAGMTENLKLGTRAAQLSPLAGPYETNRNAKHWTLKSPDNLTYEVDNLLLFVRSHPEHFANPSSAYSALTAAAKCVAGNPSPSRRDRQFVQYKGWQVLDYYPKKEDNND